MTYHISVGSGGSTVAIFVMFTVQFQQYIIPMTYHISVGSGGSTVVFFNL